MNLGTRLALIIFGVILSQILVVKAASFVLSICQATTETGERGQHEEVEMLKNKIQSPPDATVAAAGRAC